MLSLPVPCQAVVPCVCESPTVYRPRHPERTAFYRQLEEHFEDYARSHEERFEPHHGPLRPVVQKVVDEYLDCGRLHGGFARIRCPECRAEKLRAEVPAPVDHRHFVFTIPRALRGLFERERRLLGLLSQCAFEAVKRCFCALFPGPCAVPGYVGSIQTFGSKANFHPHIHALVSEGVFTKKGEFHPLPRFDRELERAVEETFRRLLLTSA